MGPTPTPTCLPGQGGQPKGNVTGNGKPSGTRRPSLDSEGFFLSDSIIDPSLVQAYRQTRFKADNGLILLVGQPNAALVQAQRQQGTDCSAFITACNPFSQPLAADQNAARLADLAKALAQRGLAFVQGIGQHPSNTWPGEASYLVLGLALEDAKALGEQFCQNAIVCSAADGVPQLILLR
jgi:hypothetical protein